MDEEELTCPICLGFGFEQIKVLFLGHVLIFSLGSFDRSMTSKDFHRIQLRYIQVTYTNDRSMWS